MLYEIKNIRQYEGEQKRRWFFDREIDLTVWFDESDDIVGFQLCYDKIQNHRALTYHKDSGYRHNRVDDGESWNSIGKGTPILFADGPFDGRRIAELFAQRSQELPKQISQYVYEKIVSFR